jgi:iron complex outermembrane receptor protein
VQARAFSGFIFGTQYVGPGQVGYSPALSNSINNNYSPGLVYWSMQLRYNVIDKPGRTLQIYGNVDNLFDKDPPITALAQTTGGGIPYDYVGRDFHIGARLTM